MLRWSVLTGRMLGALLAVVLIVGDTACGDDESIKHKHRPTLGFVVYDLDPQRHVPHAVLAARTLLAVGGWKGHITIVTSCPAADMLVAPSNEQAELWYESKWAAQRKYLSFKHVGTGTRTAKMLEASHLSRVAEAFRFLPSQVRTAIVLDRDVYAGAYLSDAIKWVRTALANAANQEHAATRQFLLAIPSQGGWATGVTVIDRLWSTSCLLACRQQVVREHSLGQSHVGAAASGAHVNASAKEAVGRQRVRYVPRVTYPEKACAPQAMPRDFHRDLSRFQVLLKETAPFVRLFLSAAQPHPENTEGQGGLFVSHREYNRYLANTLQLGSDFVAATYRAREACRDQEVAWDDDDDADAGSDAGGQGQLGETGVQGIRHSVEAPRPPQVPHIALGGFAKCATTTLYEWLIKHPNIMEPWTKEPNFDFSSYESKLGQAYLEQLLYGQRHGIEPQTGPNGTPMLSIDASTHLLWNMTHVQNLKRRNPSAKLIAVACDPTERLVSHWNYRRFVWEWEFLEGKSFDTVVRRQLEEMPSWVASADFSVDDKVKVDFELDGEDSAGVWQMVREGLYELALQRVETVFPREALLVVLKDDIQQRPLKVLQRVEEFLGIPHFDKFKEIVEQATRHNVNRHSKEMLSPEVRKEVDRFYHRHNAALAKRLGTNTNKLGWS